MNSISRQLDLPSPVSFKRSNQSLSTYTAWRLGSVLFLLIAEGAVLGIFRSEVRTAWNLTVLLASMLAIPAYVLAVYSAKQFGRGEPSRRAWLLIGPQGIADCALFVAYAGLLTLNAGSPSATVHAAASLVLTAVLINLAARGVLAYVFWKGTQLYRGIGMKVRLYRRDYATIVVLVALLAGSVAFEKDLMKVRLAAVAAKAPEMLQWFHWAEYGWLVALGFCAIFGVVVWRLQSEMGGGLVAKAWRGVLLYAAVMLIQFCFKGVAASLIAHEVVRNPTVIAALTLVGVWGLLLSEFMLLLGTSYQYEACNGKVEFNAKELEELAAEPKS
ncbi:MAG TPA: hypothetical protein VI756_23265 [Blastocatellia bacterium]